MAKVNWSESEACRLVFNTGNSSGPHTYPHTPSCVGHTHLFGQTTVPLAAGTRQLQLHTTADRWAWHSTARALRQHSVVGDSSYHGLSAAKKLPVTPKTAYFLHSLLHCHPCQLQQRSRRSRPPECHPLPHYFIHSPQHSRTYHVISRLSTSHSVAAVMICAGGRWWRTWGKCVICTRRQGQCTHNHSGLV